MPANNSLDDSEGKISQHSDEISSENNDSENYNEDLNTESDVKSTNSHDDSYSNTTCDVVIPQIDNVITKDKKFFEYDVNGDNMDSSKPTSFRKHCCKSIESHQTVLNFLELLRRIESRLMLKLTFSRYSQFILILKSLIVINCVKKLMPY